MIENPPLELVGVVHLLRPTGARATDLESLARVVGEAPPGVLFHHTAQHRLRFPSAAETPSDDFSAWVGGVLQEPETAERLQFAVQDRGRSAAETRTAILDVLRSSDRRSRPAPEGGAFILLEAESVRVPTGNVVSGAAALFEALGEADISVWFYHLIERPWFGDHSISFSAWLRAIGEPRRADWFDEAMANGQPLAAARDSVLRRWRRSLVGPRAIEAVDQSEPTRRAAGRTAVAALVRRLKTPEEKP